MSDNQLLTEIRILEILNNLFKRIKNTSNADSQDRRRITEAQNVCIPLLALLNTIPSYGLRRELGPGPRHVLVVVAMRPIRLLHPCVWYADVLGGSHGVPISAGILVAFCASPCVASTTVRRTREGQLFVATWAIAPEKPLDFVRGNVAPVAIEPAIADGSHRHPPIAGKNILYFPQDDVSRHNGIKVHVKRDTGVPNQRTCTLFS